MTLKDQNAALKDALGNVLDSQCPFVTESRIGIVAYRCAYCRRFLGLIERGSVFPCKKPDCPGVKARALLAVIDRAEDAEAAIRTHSDVIIAPGPQLEWERDDQWAMWQSGLYGIVKRRNFELPFVCLYDAEHSTMFHGTLEGAKAACEHHAATGNWDKRPWSL